MKKGFVLVWGFLIVSAGPVLAREASTSPIAFTLTTTEGDPAPVPFTLAPPSTGPTALAGPGGLGVIEDPDWPYRTALGFQALGTNLTAENNTAVGYNALYISGGSNNTAVGASSLVRSDNGSYNTAIGAGSFSMESWRSIGSYNTGIGAGAFGQIVAQLHEYNTAVGYQASYKGGVYGNTSLGALALHESDEGGGNTAVGFAALERIGGGGFDAESYNTAIGYKAGSMAGMGAYHNIFVGANQLGQLHDTHTIRIGVPFLQSGGASGQNRTFIAGIVENPFVASDIPSVVGVNSEGQLGTISSDLLPEGPQGPQGIQGPPGPTGEGLVSGSLLFLASGYGPPPGYAFLGKTEISLSVPGSKRGTKFTVDIYQKQ